MNTFFVEHEYQVKDFLNRVDCTGANWLALGPSAMHCLAEKKIPYTIPEDYAGLSEIESACQAQFERLQEACGQIDDKLQEKDYFLRKWNIRPFHFHLWQIGMVFDAVLSRSLWIRKILENREGGNIYTHVAPPEPWSLFGLGFGKQETLWGRLLLLSANADRVIPVTDSHRNFKSYMPQRKMDSIKNALKKGLNSNILLRSAAVSYQQKMLKNILNLIGVNKKQHIMVINNAYEWHDILQNLSNSEMPILFLNESNIGSRQKKYNAPEIDSADLGRQFFANMTHNGFDFSHILGDRIRWIIEKGPSAARAIVGKMEKICFKKMPLAVLSASSPDYFNYVVKQFFTVKSIPVLSWQYGAVWYEKSITQRYNLFDDTGTNILLVFGDAVKKAYELSSMPENMIIESVGSATLDNIGLAARG
ncbi:MAG: hypothetical protein CVU52_02535 [Deltaproteobacteria bacterium HGW-Deltaproteobacteria-10]|nr:MAG: hypothetical protein CVU52_02535 [Deltaproteobacteria bacterium HGW-Deltaproteobacteria-10]